MKNDFMDDIGRYVYMYHPGHDGTFKKEDRAGEEDRGGKGRVGRWIQSLLD